MQSKRIAVVTGAARGIGFACARRFAADGAQVVLGDVDGDHLDRAVDMLAAEGFAVRGCRTDVSARADVERLVGTALDAFGGIDIMLNNAGIAISKDILSITDEEYDQVLGVNLKGAFLGLQIAGKQMVEQGRGGVIINMSSINARLANPSIATYAISKGGMNQLTATGAVALAPHGIRVVGVGPGTIATEMLKEGILTNDDQRRMILSRTPSGRLGDPAEVASVAAFLASDDASYMTGQTIYPDGGRMVLNYVVPVEEA
ncbi:SDR family oxidoreductase [Sphingomonadales bacterium 56]|uniref:SDR family NAD(P)-dependent oxidoreductase n=1 Tax=unclassified Sphingobium TaxID=2611147 RepID=UPI00191833FB|nr:MULTISPECIES: SDR family oxidoreductase [unclassified Sphingobium]MBY2928380.1 SDR family oxidoreductase [Sphingomonadales bacterium 56]MBY2958480.1 SDR family oxidoreductase [Sphingomonadales bacterium 58]CAD7337138.1 putative oxidoreductase [Sphingobium sp. S6]CAD7337195.1 putative oxidoreductase [Sphingobium sp. S8]